MHANADGIADGGLEGEFDLTPAQTTPDACATTRRSNRPPANLSIRLTPADSIASARRRLIGWGAAASSTMAASGSALIVIAPCAAAPRSRRPGSCR
jgi:hypothetical protein